MENIHLLWELCHIYAERNKLQDQRNSKRYKLYRAKKKFDKCKNRQNKLLVLEREADLLNTRIELAKHVEKTHARVVKLTYELMTYQIRSADNKIKKLCVRQPTGLDVIGCEDFEKLGRRFQDLEAIARILLEDQPTKDQYTST